MKKEKFNFFAERFRSSHWIISIFLPGIGQIFNGRFAAGIFIFVLIQIFYILFLKTAAGLVYPRWDWLPEWSIVLRTYGIPMIFFVIWLLNVVDARKRPEKILTSREKFFASLLAHAVGILEVYLFLSGLTVTW